MATQYERFKSALEKMLMLDQADLDFGIYRIMNQKRNEIEEYLNTVLRKQVTEAVSGSSAAEAEATKKELDTLIATLANAGMNPDDSPKVKELRAKLSEGGDTESLENEVYSYLTTFFSRYYDGGDFISQRRYKKDVYAIPYEGEEVKLHWANADQYYIKTGEYFRSYRFNLSDGKAVEFTLKEATVEQNNNLAQNNMERRFALYEELPIEVVENTLHINFTYELYPKATKQADLIQKAFAAVKDAIPSEFIEMLTERPTEKDRHRTLLQKHLNDYVARNTFDYFIHKDLNGFLSRELDFFIKNEILVIDDIDAQNPKDFVQHLSIIKAIKTVGKKIITFLASLEDFQKKLWLKKKFVVQADYCITLDRVPEKLYPEICANDKQREEWVKLFAIDEIKTDEMFGVDYTNPLTVDFLKANPFLVLDTAFFSSDFKKKLLSEIDNIDEQCDGLMINSENFQGLQLLQEKYKEQIKCVYIDPPYNTGGDGFAYKDHLRHSSWISMVYDRVALGKTFVRSDSNFVVSIDEVEQPNLREVMDVVFGRENYISDMIWAAGRKNDSKFISISHEYMLVYVRDKKYLSDNKIEWSQKKKGLDEIYSIYEKLKKNHGHDYKSIEESLKKWYKELPDSHPSKSHKHYNRVDEGGIFFADNISWPGGGGPKYEVLHPKTKKPVTIPSRGWIYSTPERMQEMICRGLVLFGEDENSVPCLKSYLKNREYQAPYSVFYQDGRAATKRLREIIGNGNFGFPKDETVIAETISFNSNSNDIFLDYFAGSGTTGHAVINLNREDNGGRKYILCEMGDYFNTVTKPRIQKVIYSKDWKDGKPVSREGSSHCFKYMRLEQYEDTLNNLMVKSSMTADNGAFYDGYMLGYLLDTETKDSLFNLEWFRNPWNTKLRITRQNETKEENIDLIETFNYLIGLNVETILYPKEGICTVEGVTRSGERTLVIWRNVDMIDNEALNKFFEKQAYSAKDTEFDRIYVNGDNNLENLRTDEECWKVVLTEKEFAKRMFEDQ